MDSPPSSSSSSSSSSLPSSHADPPLLVPRNSAVPTVSSHLDAYKERPNGVLNPFIAENWPSSAPHLESNRLILEGEDVEAVPSFPTEAAPSRFTRQRNHSSLFRLSRTPSMPTSTTSSGEGGTNDNRKSYSGGSTSMAFSPPFPIRGPPKISTSQYLQELENDSRRRQIARFSQEYESRGKHRARPAMMIMASLAKGHSASSLSSLSSSDLTTPATGASSSFFVSQPFSLVYPNGKKEGPSSRGASLASSHGSRDGRGYGQKKAPESPRSSAAGNRRQEGILTPPHVLVAPLRSEKIDDVPGFHSAHFRDPFSRSLSPTSFGPGPTPTVFPSPQGSSGSYSLLPAISLSSPASTASPPPPPRSGLPATDLASRADLTGTPLGPFHTERTDREETPNRVVAGAEGEGVPLPPPHIRPLAVTAPVVPPPLATSTLSSLLHASPSTPFSLLEDPESLFLAGVPKSALECLLSDPVFAITSDENSQRLMLVEEEYQTRAQCMRSWQSPPSSPSSSPSPTYVERETPSNVATLLPPVLQPLPPSLTRVASHSPLPVSPTPTDSIAPSPLEPFSPSTGSTPIEEASHTSHHRCTRSSSPTIEGPMGKASRRADDQTTTYTHPKKNAAPPPSLPKAAASSSSKKRPSASRRTKSARHASHPASLLPPPFFPAAEEEEGDGRREAGRKRAATRPKGKSTPAAVMRRDRKKKVTADGAEGQKKSARGTARSASQHQAACVDPLVRKQKEEKKKKGELVPLFSSRARLLASPVSPTDDPFVSHDVGLSDRREGSSSEALRLVDGAVEVEQGTKKKRARIDPKSSALPATTSSLTPSPALLLSLKEKKTKATPSEGISSSAVGDESRREKEKKSGPTREERKKHVKKVSTPHPKNDVEIPSKRSRSKVSSSTSDAAVTTSALPLSSWGAATTKGSVVSRPLSDSLLSRGPIAASMLSSEIEKVSKEKEPRKSPSLTREDPPSVGERQALQTEVPVVLHTVVPSSLTRRSASGTPHDHTTIQAEEEEEVVVEECPPGRKSSVGSTEMESTAGRREMPREEKGTATSPLVEVPIVCPSEEGTADDAERQKDAAADGRPPPHVSNDGTDSASSQAFLFTVDGGAAASSLPEDTAAWRTGQERESRIRSTAEDEVPSQDAIPPLQPDRLAIQEEEKSGKSPTTSPAPSLSSSESRRSPPPLSMPVFDSHSSSFPLLMVGDSLSPKAYSSVASHPHSPMANESLEEEVLDDVTAPLRSAFKSIIDGSPQHGKEIEEYLEFSIPLLPFTNFLVPTSLASEVEAVETGEGKGEDDLRGKKDSAVVGHDGEGGKSVQANMPKSVRKMRREYLQSLRHKARLARPVLSSLSYPESREEENEEMQEQEESVDDLILGDTDYHHQNIQFILDLFGEFWVAKHSVSVLHCADRLGSVSSEKGVKKGSNVSPVEDSNDTKTSVEAEFEKEKLDSTNSTSEYYSMQALGVLFEYQGEVED